MDCFVASAELLAVTEFAVIAKAEQNAGPEAIYFSVFDLCLWFLVFGFLFKIPSF